MKRYSEIGNKIFNSKREDKLFVENKISMYKEIFNQLFFRLKNIDIDNIDNQFWNDKGLSEFTINFHFMDIIDVRLQNYYWRIINLFVREYINDALHFGDIRKDLESNELYLYSFCFNLCEWFNSYLLEKLDESDNYSGSKRENQYTKIFTDWGINPSPDTKLVQIIRLHFDKIHRILDIISKFCLYKMLKDKNGWVYFIKSDEAILIDEIKSEEIKLNLLDKLIDFKKCEHDPSKAMIHLFHIIKDPYSFIDGNANRTDADKYFNASLLKEWRDKTQVIRHNAGDTTSPNREENKWFKIYDEMKIEDKQKFQQGILLIALMIYVWNFSIREK